MSNNSERVKVFSSWEEVDVTHLIKKGYVKISPDKLINPHPFQFTGQEISELQKSASDILVKRNPDIDVKNVLHYDIRANTKYMYSYLLLDDPADVFVTDFFFNNEHISLYVRKSADQGVILPYSDSHWIIDSSK
jgi:hypothetical protein